MIYNKVKEDWHFWKRMPPIYAPTTNAGQERQLIAPVRSVCCKSCFDKQYLPTSLVTWLCYERRVQMIDLSSREANNVCD